MLEFVKKNMKSLLKFIPNKEEPKVDYSTKLSNTHNIQHLFIYKNERLLRLNNIGSYLWYCCWDKSDAEASIKYIEFLQFVSRKVPMRVYVVLEQVHILISLTTIDISNIYDDYISYGVTHDIKTNIFIDLLLEDVSLDIPQSFIKGKLNKAIQFHRTTLDGELDEDFNPVKDTKSKFPIEVQPNRHIVEADSIYDMRDFISYISQPLSIFVSDQDLLLFGHIMLKIDETYIDIVLCDVWDILPDILLREEVITEEDDLDDFMMALITACMKNGISLIVDDEPKSDIIHPEDSDEEIIEETLIREQPKDQQ